MPNIFSTKISKKKPNDPELGMVFHPTYRQKTFQTMSAYLKPKRNLGKRGWIACWQLLMKDLHETMFNGSLNNPYHNQLHSIVFE